jgi:alkylation response protein AidB-like acyl-CoA dehydrogenase
MLFAKDSEEDRRFRETVRAWLAKALPAAWRHHTQMLDPDILRSWHRRLFEQGWVAPHWPREFGGMGASLDEQLILLDELTQAGAPYLLPTGLNFLGQAIMGFGTDEQRRQHLPEILSGKTFWAQGYSEPNAGSDLASLSTRATEQGDHFLVSGEKIWSSYAHLCDWIFVLVRTDPQANPPHAGISMLLIDLNSPGIEIRPIRTIVGQLEFCSVRFDQVQVPVSNLLGPRNGGWKVANHVLGFERLSNGSPRNALLALRKLYAVAQANGQMADPVFSEQLAELEIDLVAHLAAYRQAITRLKAGQLDVADAPVLKLSSTELLQNINDLLLQACGDQAGSAGYMSPDGWIDTSGSFLLSRRATIYGGSSEIQRNIIAQRVLNMPRQG